MRAFLAHGSAMVHAPDQPREYAARMRQHHVEPGKRIQHAAENERSRGDARLERITEEVAEMVFTRAFAAGGRDRVQKYRQPEGLALRVNRKELLLVEVLAVHVSGHVDAADPWQL